MVPVLRGHVGAPSPLPRPPRMPQKNSKKYTRYHQKGTSWWRKCEVTLRLCRGSVPGALPSPYTRPQECPKILLKTALGTRPEGTFTPRWSPAFWVPSLLSCKQGLEQPTWIGQELFQAISGMSEGLGKQFQIACRCPRDIFTSLHHCFLPIILRASPNAIG